MYAVKHITEGAYHHSATNYSRSFCTILQNILILVKMTTAVTAASQHNEIVSRESYQKAVEDIKEAANADFYALCRKLHLKPVLDVEYYEKFLNKIIKTQSKVTLAYNAEARNAVKTITLHNDTGDVEHTTITTVNISKELYSAKKDRLDYLEDLQKKVETALNALHKVDSQVNTLVAALPLTETQFLNYVKDIVMKAKNNLSHDIFKYINMMIPANITDEILKYNKESELIKSKPTGRYDFNESLSDIVNCLVSKHINGKSNVIITAIISEFCSKCCNFITQYIVNSHTDDFIALADELKETLEYIMKSFDFGLKSWIDSCVDLSLIHMFNTLQQVKSTVKSIMEIFNKKVSLQANLAYYMEEPLEMIKIEDYFDEPVTSTTQPIVQEIDYEVNGPTIESFVNSLEIDKFYPTSELLAKYIDYFGESVSARAFSDKIAGYLKHDRETVDHAQVRGYRRVNKI